MSDVSTNGASRAPADLDRSLIEQLEAAASAWRSRAEELQGELAEARDQLARYDKSLAALTAERPAPRRGRPPGSGRPGSARAQAAGAPAHRRISDARLNRIEAAVRQLAKDKDEFRQVDVRAITNLGSGPLAIGFDLLRQEGVIRFARKEGGNKYFRMTQAALQEGDAIRERGGDE